MEPTEPTQQPKMNEENSKDSTESLQLEITFYVVAYTFIAVMIILRFKACARIMEQRRLVHNGRDFIDAPMRRKQRLRYLMETAPVKRLSKWRSSWQTEQSPLLSKFDSIDCAICLDTVSNAEKVHCLRCRHIFHCQCIERWFLGDHNNCPLCHRILCSDPDYISGLV